MVSDTAFLFHLFVPWGKTLSLVPKSRSSVKVKYQGHSFREKKKKILEKVFCLCIVDSSPINKSLDMSKWKALQKTI